MHPTPDLETVIRDVDRHVARDGWEQPPRLFALVAESAGLSVIEQPWESTGEDLLADLAAISWPPDVLGAALSVQRILEPDHEVRLTVAALRDQQVTTALRYRQHDQDEQVGVGSGVAARLERALWDTLQ
ncbi:MAG: hypothetical protein MUF33_14435 [Candidatus Nanopelagicales bacterium]|nr:hypothetical protein [Candidatus Nanopelagicales bacterium]